MGNIYVAGGVQNRGVTVYSSEGRELAFVPTPAQARNVEFARGGDRHWLYITAGGALFRIRVEQEGYHPGDTGNKDAAAQALKDAEPIIVRAAQKGVAHRKTASRKVSRLSKRIGAMGAH